MDGCKRNEINKCELSFFRLSSQFLKTFSKTEHFIYTVCPNELWPRVWSNNSAQGASILPQPFPADSIGTGDWPKKFWWPYLKKIGGLGGVKERPQIQKKIMGFHPLMLISLSNRSPLMFILKKFLFLWPKMGFLPQVCRYGSEILTGHSHTTWEHAQGEWEHSGWDFRGLPVMGLEAFPLVIPDAHFPIGFSSLMFIF